MKYLLLGGAGFIGSHLATRLIKNGHDVVIIDDLSTSTFPLGIGATFIEADIRTYEYLEPQIAAADVIYFLAASVGVNNVVSNPQGTTQNNMQLANRLIPLFEKHQKKVVFTSTSEVYGDGPFSENNNLTIGPSTNLRWSYAAAKLMTEFMITTSTFPYTIVRLFNIVGPGQLGDHGMVLPRFVNAAKTGKDLVIHGDGSQIRSFCHVEDTIDMLLQVEKINSEVFNIGNNEPVSIKDLAEQVVNLSESSSEIRYVPLEQVYEKHHGDINKRVPVLDKIKSAIDYKIKYSLDDIIKDML
jgi:UDP-glucose 4-epimerase